MKKIVALLLAALFIVSLSACAANDNKLVAATNAEFAPWEKLDKENNPIGIDIDIMNAVAKKMGMEVKWENMEFESVLGAIQSGSADVGISGLTINAKRMKTCDFVPYYEGASQIIIVPADDTVFTGTTKEELDEQLKGKKIGVCGGFTGEFYAKGDEEWGFKAIEDAKISTFKNIGLAIADLANGNIDVIIMDDSVALNAAKEDDSIKAINIALTTETYGIGVKKGDKVMFEKVEKAVKELKESGELEKIIEEGLKNINYADEEESQTDSTAE